jgi:hypothetical protein
MRGCKHEERVTLMNSRDKILHIGGPSKCICPHQNHFVPRHINNRYYIGGAARKRKEKRHNLAVKYMQQLTMNMHWHVPSKHQQKPNS